MCEPRVYKRERSENFRELIRKFRTKYVRATSCEATLVDIIGETNSSGGGGGAKNVFMALLGEAMEGDSK